MDNIGKNPSIDNHHSSIINSIKGYSRLNGIESVATADGIKGKNQIIVLLPMTHRGKAKVALRRAMKILHQKPIDFEGTALEIKVAGVLVDYDLKEADNASSVADHLSAQLAEMATRIGNIHAYS